MEFEWNEAKDRANRLKHGFDFTLPAASLTDRVRRFVDPRPWGEQRLVATGQVEGRFITVVYTGGVIAIASFRRCAPSTNQREGRVDRPRVASLSREPSSKRPPDETAGYSSALTISSHIFLASPNSIIVLLR